MRTIQIKINASKKYCGVNLMKQCEYNKRTLVGVWYCSLFMEILKLHKIEDASSCFRCQQCIDAEVKG